MNMRMLGGFAAGVVLVLGGCGQRRYEAPPTAVQDPAAYPQITLSPELAGWVAADRPVVSQGEDGSGPLRVTVPVRTLVKRGETMRVQYRFVFLDSMGRPVEPQGDWRYVRLPANERRYFEGNALDGRATDWQLEIRTAR
jgi:hypothetical protein